MTTKAQPLEDASRALWDTYTTTNETDVEATETQEEFWEAYDTLKQNAQSQQKYSIQAIDQLTDIPRLFRSQLSIPREENNKFDKAVLNYNWKFYKSFSLLPIVVPLSLMVTGKFTEFAPFLASFVTTTTLFAIPYTRSTRRLRKLAHTQIEVKPRSIIRSGKGIPKRMVQFSEIAALETDELGLIVKVRNTNKKGRTVIADAFTIPFVLDNFEELKVFLEEVVRLNKERKLEE
ncbi:hypothetical protein BKI52_25580 [marine bacterium AO1-C]|nr:hypothetical protein BKI52_25580 [marine bacterium AO1-C]